MVWLQQDLDTMRAEAKKHFHNTRLGDCSYCGKLIKCDMYRHVATYHLASCGGVRCHDTRCGRARHRIAWIQGAHDLQASRSLYRRGRFSVKFGRILSSPVIRGYLLTCYCSARSMNRWFIMIVYTSVGYRILFSGRII